MDRHNYFRIVMHSNRCLTWKSIEFTKTSSASDAFCCLPTGLSSIYFGQLLDKGAFEICTLNQVPYLVWKSGEFTKTSSASDAFCCLPTGLSSSASDESETLGGVVDVDCCCADKGVNVTVRLGAGLCPVAEVLLPN